MIRIIKYTNQHSQIEHLLVELQEYLVSIDPEKVQVIDEQYGKKYFQYLLRQIKENHGIIFLAYSDNDAIGLIAGYIEPKDEEDEISNRCPKRGIISDLIVSATSREKGVGGHLMKSIENYFSEQGCEFVAVNAFGPNTTAKNFYDSLGYIPRNIEYYKRIN